MFHVYRKDELQTQSWTTLLFRPCREKRWLNGRFGFTHTTTSLNVSFRHNSTADRYIIKPQFSDEETGCTIANQYVISIRRRWNYENNCAAIICYVSTGV